MRRCCRSCASSPRRCTPSGPRPRGSARAAGRCASAPRSRWCAPKAQRAAWLADAAAAVAADPACALDTIDLAEILRRVVTASEPAQRITGQAPSVYIASTPSTIRGDERLLEAALGGMLVAMSAVIEDCRTGARLAIRLAPAHEDPSRLTLTVTQGSVVVPAPAMAHFFDDRCAEHPAGRVGALHLAAAQRIACLHGGDLVVTALEGGGCAVAFSIRGSA